MKQASPEFRESGRCVRCGSPVQSDSETVIYCSCCWEEIAARVERSVPAVTAPNRTRKPIHA
jgi:predicted amidophosphoribosyltransferase